METTHPCELTPPAAARGSAPSPSQASETRPLRRAAASGSANPRHPSRGTARSQPPYHDHKNNIKKHHKSDGSSEVNRSFGSIDLPKVIGNNRKSISMTSDLGRYRDNAIMWSTHLQPHEICQNRPRYHKQLMDDCLCTCITAVQR